MQVTQLGAVTIALGVVLALAVLAMLVWRWRSRDLNGENPEARCRRDIHALRHGHRPPSSALRSDDVWEAGAPSDPPHSRAKKAVTWVAAGTVGGCGGCGCGGYQGGAHAKRRPIEMQSTRQVTRERSRPDRWLARQRRRGNGLDRSYAAAAELELPPAVFKTCPWQPRELVETGLRQWLRCCAAAPAGRTGDRDALARGGRALGPRSGPRRGDPGRHDQTPSGRPELSRYSIFGIRG